MGEAVINSAGEARPWLFNEWASEKDDPALRGNIRSISSLGDISQGLSSKSRRSEPQQRHGMCPKSYSSGAVSRGRMHISRGCLAGSSALRISKRPKTRSHGAAAVSWLWTTCIFSKTAHIASISYPPISIRPRMSWRPLSRKAGFPNFICENPANGHVHATWILYKAVWEMNPQACSIACSIERAITRRLDGDIAFSMTGLCKNPLHGWWNVSRPREEPYTLEELSSFFNAKEMKPWTKREKRTGYGRNVFVFDGAGEHARGIVLDCKRKDWHRSEFGQHIDDVAWDMNLAAPFAYPLSRGEVAEIAAKVAGWTWMTFSEDGLRRWHSMKGRAGMRSRWAGHTPAAKIAQELSISTKTVYRRKVGSPSLIALSSPDIVIGTWGSLTQSHQPKVAMPWELENMPRSTWYRKQKERKAA